MIRSGPGYAAAGFVLLFIFGPLIMVFVKAGGGVLPGPGDWAAIRFSITQATLSALFSTVLAIPVARALARRQFRGRGVLITLLGAPFILPVIVAVLGLLAVFGRSGALNSLLIWIGVPPVQIYGLHGVVLAHVFFNLPLATRILLQAWQQIPAERFRLAASLNLSAGQIARQLEFPMLRAAAPGAFVVIFALCLSSFTVALTLGGGPKATTVELAIYQAFRFDFDLGRAAMLAVIQTLLVGIVALFALKYSHGEGFGAGLDRVVTRWDAQSTLLRLNDALILIFAALFLLLPLTMVVINGIAGWSRMPAQVYSALWVSVTIALLSTALTLALALPLALTALRRGWIEVIGLFGIVSSPLVLGTGLFLIVHPFADPARLAFAVTGLVNALMALPFTLRVLIPSLRASEQNYGRLADSLGLTGWTRLRLLLLPRARRALGFAAGLTAAMSMGDLGVITLFADPSHATLPLQMYRLMGAFRMEAAAGAGLVLLMSSLGLFWILDKGGRGDVDA
ncbi:Sulfate transport system permease protein CysW [Thalassovita gelatinovora]|uniref:Sulfate transport system permease protein CysW n=1 Tax=Thalassovita gelatinovora TaxID=53501 RepID=A0A0P1F6E3_THAGE|nr:Sulfate transport system permease protein CysW [Thalassovita gelatinovora]SEQ67945.1 thiamine transport system permease protein [Thalassovita gelatinovora]